MDTSVAMTHRIYAVLFRCYPAALSVDVISNVVVCSRSQIGALLERMLRAHLIAQQPSSDGAQLYRLAQTKPVTRSERISD